MTDRNSPLPIPQFGTRNSQSPLTPFYCVLSNHQPMGFYPSKVIVDDACRHSVELLPPDINSSGWQYTLE
jgi:hypothetical protein